MRLNLRALQRPAAPLWLLFPIFFVAVLLTHTTLLRLPYFWDEGGYYIPAALDFFHTGTLIPKSTLTNAHPPLPSILLAAWWHLAGLSILSTRTFICLVAAAALLGVYRLSRALEGGGIAAATTLLTALYPVWFAQSTLAHADIFAAAFTLWALSFYLPRTRDPSQTSARELVATAVLFSLAALAKETAIVTPLALAAWELARTLRQVRSGSWLSLLSFSKGVGAEARHLRWSIALAAPLLPLAAWYGFHFHRTGFVFGNPEFLRYNATANLDGYRLVLCLWHRLLHLTAHMNLFVPVACTVAVLFISPRRRGLPRPTNHAILILLLANWLAFSVLGGALLTRYLLPLYPLILLLCIVVWQRRTRAWPALATLAAAAFLCGLWINPPYAFAPEDNLSYRDMIVLHQKAISFLRQQYPTATVLTAWPASAELTRPDIGYTQRPFHVWEVRNFSAAAMQHAAANPAGFDTAFLFSTKWEPPPGSLNLGRDHEQADARFFDFHHDLTPTEAAALLHATIAWQANRNGEWAAVLRIPAPFRVN